MKRIVTLTALGLTVVAPDVIRAEDHALPGPGTARDEECLVCHAGVGEEDAPKLDLDLYRKTTHGAEGCIGCHTDVEDESIHHEELDEDLAPVDCGPCHEDAAATFASSAHATQAESKRSVANNASPEKPTCARCHGAHDIRQPIDPWSRVSAVRQAETCGDCHGPQRQAAGHRLVPLASAETAPTPPSARADDDADAKPLIDAACTDCHGSHGTQTATAPTSSLFPDRVAQTCEACHEDEAQDFGSSAHADAANKDDFRWSSELAAKSLNHLVEHDHSPESNGARTPPVCITCHRMHDAGAPQTARFREDLVRECGTCHQSLMQTYVESYHGKATLLGANSVAKCSDCHGFHRIRGPDDPESRVSTGNKLETCRSCHDDAPARFADFWAHADHTDAEQFPILYWVYTFMTALLVSVFSFFGLHTLLWAIREGVDAIRLRGQPRPIYKGPRVRRFSTTDRILHFFVIISFLGLAATGAPLKFAEASWARAAFAAMGGVETAGLLHRVFAVITFGYFFAHLIQLVVNLIGPLREGRFFKTVFGPDSLVPRWSDMTDVFRHFVWFVGLGPKPTWERWTYWEKFDYWAVFWGVAIIGTSGLVLWFPTFFTVLLPGWVVNVALVVHSDEALLAIGFIFGVHFFNSHLRRSKFPMDEVMFTGSVPKDEYREERGREWQRLEAEDRASGKFVEDPHPVFRAWARVFGISAWLFGLFILGLIIHGFLTTH